MWAVFLVATPLILFRQQLWSLYLGSELQVYADIPLVMVLLLARYWIEGPMSMIGLAAYAMNRMRWLSILVIASSIFNVVITVYFVRVRHMGAVGSALGTLISILLLVPFPMGKFALDLLGLKLGTWLKVEVWRGVLPSAVAGLFGLAWRYLLHPHTAPELFLAVATVATVYLLTILLSCLDQDEYRQLKYLFAKLSWQKAL